MHAPTGRSGPLQPQPSHSQQLGFRPTSRHRARATPARCLQCATKQLQQVFMLPLISSRQQAPIGVQHVEQEPLQPQQFVQQQCVNLLQQQPFRNILQSRAHKQQQQQLQLAYASSSSSSSSAPLYTSAAVQSFPLKTSVQPQQPAQRRTSRTPASSSLYDSSSGGAAGNESSSSKSSSRPLDDASFDGLPPLSSLVGSPSSQSIASDHLQQEDSTERGRADTLAAPAAAAAGGSHSTDASLSSSSSSSSSSAPEQQPEESAGVKAALAMLKWYKSVLSPMMQSTCRFLPTCSQYSMDSYRSYGVAKGTVLTAWRLLRCNPWGASGYDPTQWPPPGLAWLFQYRYSAEVAVVVGTATFVRLAHALLFE